MRVAVLRNKHDRSYDWSNLIKQYPFEIVFVDGFDNLTIEDNLIGLGLSDKEFFKQLTPILKDEYQKNGKFMATLIMLSNHTPFDATDKYGEFDVDIKETVTEPNEYGEVVGITSGSFYDGSQANLNYAWSINALRSHIRFSN